MGRRVNGWGRRALAAGSLGCLAWLAACVALLDGVPELGEHCSFEGELATCGRCIAGRCRAEVDACCGGCGDALEDLDACAPGGDVEACQRLKRAGSEEDDAVAFASCVELSCGAACPSSGPVTVCEPDTDGCSCTFDDASDDTTVCEGNPGVCCADAGWPGPGLDCACVDVSCTSITGLCYCEPGPGDSTSCDDRGLPFCCATDDGCECRDSLPCEDLGETPVASCRVDSFACGGGTTRVDHCQATDDDVGG